VRDTQTDMPARICIFLILFFVPVWMKWNWDTRQMLTSFPLVKELKGEILLLGYGEMHFPVIF